MSRDDILNVKPAFYLTEKEVAILSKSQKTERETVPVYLELPACPNLEPLPSFRALNKEQVDYPRDAFSDIVLGNSPYAFYLFQWVNYKEDAMRYRLKLLHDVKLFDGTIVENCYPNANSFHGKVRVDDKDVEFIRISKNQYGNAYKDPRIKEEKNGD